MIRKWISLINIVIGAASLALLVLAMSLSLLRPWEIFTPEELPIRTSLPKGAFAYSKTEYDAIDGPVLALRFSPLTYQLPDLRKSLIFYGKNGRPDAKNIHSLLHFTFAGNKTISSLTPGEKLYISYDKTLTPPQFVFSPENQPTALWIETEFQGNEANVKVTAQTEEGHLISEPAMYAQFSLPPKEFMRMGGAPWELGHWRVDGSLLARQKARWYGFDRFLERHGGDEFAFLQGKHRIDFGEEGESYSVFLGVNDCLVWNEGRWEAANPGDDSLGKPLICINKIDERLMNLELWDVEGKAKVNLNLLKSHEAWQSQSLEENFRFVGARTRSQYVFEIDDERILLRPHDWLVLTEEGWKKLSTIEEIDDFVERRTTGTLFVFDGVERKDDRQVLVGTVFNNSRTDSQSIELPMLQGSFGPGSVEKKPNTETDENGERMPVARHHVAPSLRSSFAMESRDCVEDDS